MKMIKMLLLAASMLLSAKIASAGSLYASVICSTPGQSLQDGMYGDYTPPYNWGSIGGSVSLWEAYGGIATGTVGTSGPNNFSPVTYTTEYNTWHQVDLPCDGYVYIYANASVPSGATGGYATATVDIYW